MSLRSRVLVVDDNETMREVILSILDTTRFDVVTAENGAEGLLKADEFRPDLILLDAMMPGIDGFEVCRLMREMEGLKEVPILLMTALDDGDARRLAMEAGTEEVIGKPFTFAELRARVDALTDRGGTRHAAPSA